MCALDRVRKSLRAVARKKRPHQSAPYAAWVSAMPSSPAKNPHHPLPKSRALAHRLRAAATHCFNFVAIMRQSAANGKHNTAVLAHRTRATCGARSHIARFGAPFSRRCGRAFAPAATRFIKRGKARRWTTAIGWRLGDDVLAHAGDGVRHLAAGLRHHRFGRMLVTRTRWPLNDCAAKASRHSIWRFMKSDVDASAAHCPPPSPTGSSARASCIGIECARGSPIRCLGY